MLFRWVLCVCVAVALFAPDAAAKKKKRRRADPLAVVVLPFSGKGAGGQGAKEALELELELVEEAQVSSSETLEGDLKRLGGRAFDASSLASVLQRRDVDVLVRGERGAGQRTPDALLVIAYGKDGQPRFFRELSLGGEPDTTATAVIEALRPVLSSWKTQRPVRLPEADEDDGSKAGGSRVFNPNDVLVDDDDLLTGGGGKKKKDEKPARDVLDDDPEERPTRLAVKEEEPAPKRSPLDFNSSDDEDERPKKRERASLDDADDERPKKKRASLDDDSPPEEERIARADLDDSAVDDRGRRSIPDVEDEIEDGDAPKKVTPGHTVAITAAFEGATWYYSFDGDPIGDAKLNAPFFPGGGIRIDAVPFAFAGIRFVGLDLDLGGSVVPFKIESAALQVTPSEFSSVQIRAGATAKLRYTLNNGLAFGARFGYRYYGANVESQTVQIGAETQSLTVVPGYAFNSGTVGAEVFLPLLIANRRLEAELCADFLALTRYEELPDNPGAVEVGFGWNALLAVRFELFNGVFLEGRGFTVGAIIDYTDQGSRQIFVGNQLETLAGGDVTNLTAGFAFGAGYMF